MLQSQRYFHFICTFIFPARCGSYITTHHLLNTPSLVRDVCYASREKCSLRPPNLRTNFLIFKHAHLINNQHRLRWHNSRQFTRFYTGPEGATKTMWHALRTAKWFEGTWRFTAPRSIRNTDKGGVFHSLLACAGTVYMIEDPFNQQRWQLLKCRTSRKKHPFWAPADLQFSKLQHENIALYITKEM